MIISSARFAADIKFVFIRNNGNQEKSKPFRGIYELVLCCNYATETVLSLCRQGLSFYFSSKDHKHLIQPQFIL